jgi:hypothetical protein
MASLISISTALIKNISRYLVGNFNSMPVSFTLLGAYASLLLLTVVLLVNGIKHFIRKSDTADI